MNAWIYSIAPLAVGMGAIFLGVSFSPYRDVLPPLLMFIVAVNYSLLGTLLLGKWHKWACKSL